MHKSSVQSQINLHCCITRPHIKIQTSSSTPAGLYMPPQRCSHDRSDLCQHSIFELHIIPLLLSLLSFFFGDNVLYYPFRDYNMHPKLITVYLKLVLFISSLKNVRTVIYLSDSLFVLISKTTVLYKINICFPYIHGIEKGAKKSLNSQINNIVSAGVFT